MFLGPDSRVDGAHALDVLNQYKEVEKIFKQKTPYRLSDQDLTDFSTYKRKDLVDVYGASETEGVFLADKLVEHGRRDAYCLVIHGLYPKDWQIRLKTPGFWELYLLLGKAPAPSDSWAIIYNWKEVAQEAVNGTGTLFRTKLDTIPKEAHLNLPILDRIQREVHNLQAFHHSRSSELEENAICRSKWETEYLNWQKHREKHSKAEEPEEPQPKEKYQTAYERDHKMGFFDNGRVYCGACGHLFAANG
ncbi:hypothetical protein T439DRAFT_298893, partial [Meredithblackwellia eburnea MCA 4105]